MAISNKTRKALWAKSGNRCLLCRIELVQEVNEPNANVIIGEECHIISSKKDGPRGTSTIACDFDDYENLMLLCANDHKRVDELTDIYTVDGLILFKTIHEAWVKTTLEKDVTAFTNDKANVKSLPMITTGKQLVDLINGAHLFDFDHEELKTEYEAELIGGLFENLKDWGDMLSDVGYTERVNLTIEFNRDIERIKQEGFTLFGLRRQIRLRNDKKEDMGLYDVSTLLAFRHDNPSIIGNYVIAQFPTKYSFM